MNASTTRSYLVFVVERRIENDEFNFMSNSSKFVKFFSPRAPARTTLGLREACYNSYARARKAKIRLSGLSFVFLARISFLPTTPSLGPSELRVADTTSNDFTFVGQVSSQTCQHNNFFTNKTTSTMSGTYRSFPP
jgi:hypothetical protein